MFDFENFELKWSHIAVIIAFAFVLAVIIR